MTLRIWHHNSADGNDIFFRPVRDIGLYIIIIITIIIIIIIIIIIATRVRYIFCCAVLRPDEGFANHLSADPGYWPASPKTCWK